MATKKAEEKATDVFHVRLRKASMFIDSLSGLHLSVPEEKFSGTIPKDTPDARLIRVKKAITVGSIEVFNPNMPDMTEPPKPKKKDLTRTSEFRVLSHPDVDEIKRYIELVATKKQRGLLSLKILYRLETDGENPMLSPRGEIVDLLLEKFKALGITRKELNDMEIENIVVLNEVPSDIVIT